MAFPAGLSPRVDMFYSGLWNNITGDVHSRDGESSIEIRQGRDTEDSALVPAQCNFALKNPTGTYSPRNPNSPLYGLIGRNTPVRVGIGRPTLGAASKTSADSTSLVAPTITAEVSSLQIAVWAATPVGDITVPGGFTAANESDVSPIMTVRGAYKSVSAGATGTATATFSVTATSQSAINMVVPGGTFVQQTSATLGNGSDVGLTTPSFTAGNFLVLVTAWSDDLEDRMQPVKIQGDRAGGWFLIADTGISTEVNQPRLQAWGWWIPTTGTQVFSLVGQRDGSGGTSLRLFEMSGVSAYYWRFNGEISEFPVVWNHRGTDVSTPIEAGGASRRLSQTSQQAGRSSTYESFIRRTQTVAYWPLEDGVDADTFSSGLPAGNAMVFAPGGASGRMAPVLAAYDALPGSDPLPTFNQAGGIGLVGTYANTGRVACGQIVSIPAAGTAAGSNLFKAEFSTGTIASYTLEYTSDTLVTRKIVDSAGATIVNQALGAPSDGLNGETYIVYAVLGQNGTSVDHNLIWFRITPGQGITQPASLLYANANLTTQTLGIVRRYTIGVETNGNLLLTNAVAFGHAFVANNDVVFNTNDYALSPFSPSALVGWFGSKISDRIYRLGTDSGVKTNVAHNDKDQLLGYQVPGTLFDQITDAAASGGGGQLADSFGYLGLNWRELESKESKTPRMTFSYSAGTLSDPLQPTDDDRYTTNDQTVSRREGGSGRAIVVSGPLSTAKSPLGVGLYRDTVDISLYLDSQAQSMAEWLVSLGTVDEPRWGTLVFDLALAANAAQIDTMKYLSLGDTIALANLPTFLPPGSGAEGSVLMILEGYTESIGFTTWKIAANLSPAKGLQTGKVETATYDRIGDDGFQTLTSGVTSTATSISATTLSGAVLTNAAADLPYSIFIAGEELSVTAVGGATSPQTLTVVRSVNGIAKAQSAGAAITIARAIVLALGGS